MLEIEEGIDGRLRDGSTDDSNDCKVLVKALGIANGATLGNDVGIDDSKWCAWWKCGTDNAKLFVLLIHFLTEILVVLILRQELMYDLQMVQLIVQNLEQSMAQLTKL